MIKNYEAGEIMMVKQGVRKYLNPKKSCLPNSLLRDFLLTNGMSVKNETTEDVIQLSFDYGTVSEEEDLKRFGELKCDSCFYEKISKDDLRIEYYQKGVFINNIHYKRLYRSTGSAKKGSVIFIREELWDKANDYITMGMKFIEGQKEKVVELQAYQALCASGTEDRVVIRPENIFIVDDETVSFQKNVDVIQKGEKELELVNKTILMKSSLNDGMGIVQKELVPNGRSMMLLRQHMFKSNMLACDIQKFVQEYCSENQIEYDSFEVTDYFGHKHLAKDIQLITDINSIKWIKFRDKMGNDPLQYWIDRVHQDGDRFGIVKQEHPSKFYKGQKNRLSYQMINSSLLTYNEVRELLKDDLQRITDLKANDEAFLMYLEENQAIMNCYQMCLELISWNRELIHTDFIQDIRDGIVKAEIASLRNGHCFVNGDNLVLAGNPYELLQRAITGKYEPIFDKREDCIEVYTPRFQDGEYLCAFRSPQNSFANIGYFQNRKIPELEKYFRLSPNVLIANAYHSDIEERLNGADWDGDMALVTNNPLLVRSARQCYEQHKTVVNQIPLVGKNKYRNTQEDLARLDAICQSTQAGIGLSSNVSQYALSQWHENGSEELKKIIVSMAVVSQCTIDASKRLFDIDTNAEIKKSQKALPKGTPYFFRIVAGKQNDLKMLKCPMNFLQTIVQKDLPKVRKKEVKELVSFKVKLPSYRKCNYKQVDRLIALCERHVKRVDYLRLNYDREDYHRLLVLEDEKFRTDIQKVRIKDNETINVAVKRILSDESYKRLRRVVLKSLFELNRERFLAQFERN